MDYYTKSSDSECQIALLIPRKANLFVAYPDNLFTQSNSHNAVLKHEPQTLLRVNK